MVNKLKFFIIVLSIIFLSGVSIACVDTTINDPLVIEDGFNRFSSEAEINEFLQRQTLTSYFGGLARNTVMMESSEAMPAMDSVSQDSLLGSSDINVLDYSETNVQVKGVDEADIVKTDGEHIYYVSRNVLYIVDLYNEMEVVSEIDIESAQIQEIYLYNDKIVLLGRINAQRDFAQPEIARIIPPYIPYHSESFVAIYDISDKTSPIEEEFISTEGNYFNSRMIGEHVYVIINKFAGNNFIPPIIAYRGGERTIHASDVYYFDIYDNSYEMSIIFAIDLEDNSFEEKTILKSSSQNIFVSHENIYLTGRNNIPYTYEQRRIIDEVYKFELPRKIIDDINRIDDYDIRESTKINEIEHIVQTYIYGLEQRERERVIEILGEYIEKIQDEIAKERDTTIINRISIDGKNTVMEAEGRVPGYVLNQFSMDENNGFFRIATTSGSMWDKRNPSRNNIYVLNMDLDVVGSLEGIAPMERIYSVRFMQDKAYMVTFRTIDPLFVIDLKDPQNPSILGELKIPGYSDYLHPYDENHIIGIGKEVVEDNEIAIPEGVKLALFDVSDVNNPKEIAKIEIGHRGSDSEALHNHKAFLFDKTRDLLVIPVIERDRPEDDSRPWAYGDVVFQGAYVFTITPEDGFVVDAKITHFGENAESSRMYLWSDNSIRRSLYVGDVLYTLSNRMIKANSLTSYDEIYSITLFESDEKEDIYYGGRVVSSSNSVSEDSIEVISVPELEN